MKLSTRSVPRWPRIPVGIVLFLGIWALMVLVTHLLGRYYGIKPDLCLFHRLTGESCPTCGTTRGLLALARGDWRASFLWNPMTMVGGWIIAIVLAARALTGRMVDVELTRLERRIMGFLGLAILLVNWAWLIYSHP